MLAVGQSNSTHFLRPVTAGRVHAEGVALHRGRTTWIWDVRFTDDGERLCAITRMTMAVRPQDGLTGLVEQVRLHRPALALDRHLAE